MSSLVRLGGRKVVAPAAKIQKGLVIGIPSLGMVPTPFAISLGTQHQPINFGMGYCSPEDVRWDWEKNETVPDSGRRALPVADARNVIAEYALKGGAEWLFFKDDDTVAPPDAINKLYTLYRDALAEGRPVACIGGNYMSKQCPPHSLILKDGHMGGFEDWNYGDVVGGENTAIGMGCTLIHIPTTIAKMPAPWFKTVKSMTPHLMAPNDITPYLVDVGNDIQEAAPFCACMTEDVYFCRKASLYGATEVYCDTSIQCTHIDIHTGRKYYYHPGLRRGVWQDGHVMSWYIRAGEKFDASVVTGVSPNPIDPEKRPEVVRFDLGTPGHKDGWITVDLFEPTADERVDITNMRPLVDKYGKADEIRASHILEHFSFRDTQRILMEWISTLKPGGSLFIEVPDLEWCCERMLAFKDADPPAYGDEIYKVYGLQSNPGDLHKTGFTKGYLKKVLEDPVLGLEDIVVEWHSYPDPRVQRAVRATAKRKAAPTPEERKVSERELVLQD